MTTIIVSAPDVAWLTPTADLLRERGLKVVCLGSLSIIGFLLMSERIATVVVHQDCIPEEWDAMRERMQRIAPRSKILVIERGDARAPTELAAWVADA